jgi:hypothetical protein
MFHARTADLYDSIDRINRSKRLMTKWVGGLPYNPIISIQDALENYCNHVALMTTDLMIPKHHLLFHLIVNSKYFGNPSAYATWLDESLNKLLKACCRQTSQSTFDRSVLNRMRVMLRE